MYRLIDDVARRRMLYPSPIVTVASAMVIDIPSFKRGAGLALGRYYVIVLENAAEVGEAESFLTAPRPGPIAPDIFDRRPSQLRTDQVVVTRYDPPDTGWPWLSICRWPATSVAPGDEMARGCYTMEVFDSADMLAAHQAELVRSLARRCQITVRLIAGDRLGAAGRC